MTLRRREMLKLTAATASVSVVGLAGCAEVGDLSEDDVPEYTRWLAADSEEVFFVYADWNRLDEFADETFAFEGDWGDDWNDSLDDWENDWNDSLDDWEDDWNDSLDDWNDSTHDWNGSLDDWEDSTYDWNDSLDDWNDSLDDWEDDWNDSAYDWNDDFDEWEDELWDEDPMVALPTVGVVVLAFGVGFAVVGTGLQRFVGAGTSEDVETSLDETLLCDGGIVFVGDVDVDEVTEYLTSEPEGLFDPEYERVETVDEYGVYRPVDELSGLDTGWGTAVAVGEDAIVLSSGRDDPVEAVRGTIEARVGAAPRATDESEDFEWLVSAAGHGDLAVGAYGDGEVDEFDDELLRSVDQPTGAVASLAFESDEDGEREVSGRFALVAEDIDEEEAATDLEETLGDDAVEKTIDLDEDRVAVEAVWDDEAFAE